MKEANLISIIAANKQLDRGVFKSFLEYFNIKIKSEEVEHLENLISNMQQLDINSYLYDSYYIGYHIPQIGKEFDLLRIGKDYIINIELKRTSTNEKIEKQLKKNQYYLSFLNKKIYSFTYIAETNILFKIDETGMLKDTNFEYLVEIISRQIVEKIIDIDTIFNPSNYLVSPFNSTHEFISNQYFLTSQQEEFKNIILEKLESQNNEILAVKGNAGTGKTLSTYDIAKECIRSNKKVLIIHCGILNSGHHILREKHQWNIQPAKNINKICFNEFNLIIVDEAQRIYPPQLKHIIETVSKVPSKCIFSYDGQQCLRKWEIDNNNEVSIESTLTLSPFELTGKIRTNKEIASFILCLFDKNRQIEKIKRPNVELNYFNNYMEAKSYLLEKQKDNWKSINYTPSMKRYPYDSHNLEGNHDTAHTVIGQEYDKVLAVIDQYFFYKNGKDLSTKNYPNQPYYHPSNMLFQIMSRTRIKLGVVIIGNKEILERCLSILHH